MSARFAFESHLDAPVWVDKNRDGVLAAHLHDPALQRLVIIYRNLFERDPTLGEDTPHPDTRGSVAERVHDEAAFD